MTFIVSVDTPEEFRDEMVKFLQDQARLSIIRSDRTTGLQKKLEVDRSGVYSRLAEMMANIHIESKQEAEERKQRAASFAETRNDK